MYARYMNMQDYGILGLMLQPGYPALKNNSRYYVWIIIKCFIIIVDWALCRFDILWQPFFKGLFVAFQSI
jgi:hypothetical protein